MKCKNCQEKEAIKYSKYSTGEFCSGYCAKSYSNKFVKVNKQANCIDCKKKLIISSQASIKTCRCEDCKKKVKGKKIHAYKCEKCGETFNRLTIHRDRKIHCEKCKRQVRYINDIEKVKSILELSSRTVQKIIKRANRKCEICGWNESTCDIHHVIEKKNKGTDDSNNLIIICPNCHRVIHTNKDKYKKEFLLTKTIDKTFLDWKKYYAINMIEKFKPV